MNPVERVKDMKARGLPLKKLEKVLLIRADQGLGLIEAMAYLREQNDDFDDPGIGARKQ